MIDAPDALRAEVAKVYAASELTPQKGRWGQPKKAATNAKDTQDKVLSAPIVIAAASETIRTSGTTLESASDSVWDMADSVLDAARAANGTDSTETRETKNAAAVKLLAASVLLAVASATLTETGPTAAAEKKAAAARFPREETTEETEAEAV